MRYAAVLLLLVPLLGSAATKILVPPAQEDDAFGSAVIALPDGRIAVADREYDLPDAQNVGAVHLYDVTGRRLQTLAGALENGRLGDLQLLADGSLLIYSPMSVTRVRPQQPLPAQIDAQTSFVGDGTLLFPSRAVEVQVGFVLLSRGGTGAATYFAYDQATIGTPATVPSLRGSRAGDFSPAAGFHPPGFGRAQVVALANGGYAVATPAWDLDAATPNVGAVTVCRPSCIGTVGPQRSLHGASPEDAVGTLVVALRTGGAAVLSPSWDAAALDDAGAITVIAAQDAPAGACDAANSVVGSHAGDFSGVNYADVVGFWPLAGGGVLATAPRWDHDDTQDVGAAIALASGAAGEISPATALVGGSAADGLLMHAAALAGGGYAVAFPLWDAAEQSDVGAVALSADASLTGTIGPGNALHGSTAGDRVGLVLAALRDGDAVVGSPNRDEGALQDVGAITRLDADAPVIGPVTAANSTLGAIAGDHAGSRVLALDNGHFIVASPDWQLVAGEPVGALTWFDGEGVGAPARIGAENSLIGDGGMDGIGSGTLLALAQSRYLVGSPLYGPGLAPGVSGAVAWLDGEGPTVDLVSLQNAIVGSEDEQFGEALHLQKDEAVIAVNRAAARFGIASGSVYLIGAEGAGAADAVLQHQRADGAVANAGTALAWHYQPSGTLLAVGDPRGRRVTLVKPGEPVQIQITAIEPALPSSDQPILVRGLLHSATPALSTVRVTAGGLVLCEGSTQPTPTAGVTAFECSFAAPAPGQYTISAGFVSTPTHGAFDPDSVEIQVHPPAAKVFDDGFETLPAGDP